jgi:hypothetical protein
MYYSRYNRYVYSLRTGGQKVPQILYPKDVCRVLPEVSLDNNRQEDTVEVLCRTDTKLKNHVMMHAFLFFFKVLLHRSTTFSCRRGGLTRTLPSSTLLSWHTCLHAALSFSLAGCSVTSHHAVLAWFCMLFYELSGCGNRLFKPVVSLAKY